MSVTKAEKARVKALRLVFPSGLPDHARLVDLVRYCRHHLHREELITDEEYAALASVDGAVQRLEMYDVIVRRAREANAINAE